MDDFFAAAVKHFSFTEMMCFYLLWRVENKLAAVADAINRVGTKIDIQTDTRE